MNRTQKVAVVVGVVVVAGLIDPAYGGMSRTTPFDSP